MILNFEQAKEKFGVGYTINSLNRDTINESFSLTENQSQNRIYKNIEDAIENLGYIEQLEIKNKISRLNATLNIYDNMSFFDKLMNKKDISNLKNKIVDLEKSTNKENAQILRSELLERLEIKYLDKSINYNVELSDLKVSDEIFKVSLYEKDLCVLKLRVQEIKYYLINNNHFKIKIYCISSEGKDLIQLSNNTASITNGVLNEYIFYNENEANIFLKNHLQERIKIYQEKLQAISYI